MSAPVQSLIEVRRTSLPDTADQDRRELRSFIKDAVAGLRFEPRCDAWLTGFDPGFSRALAERGWVGMTVPAKYGGHGRSPLERYIVQEELLAAGAPVAAHWIADRQTAPTILRYGTEEQREDFLPRIAQGNCYFAIGMSEPDSGSDLASVRTGAVKQGSAWQINGTKVWTSNAHRCHYMLTLCRTGPAEPLKRDGLTQFIIDLSSPGVTVRPIELIGGEAHFNEVVLRNVTVTDDHRVGAVGAGWEQVTAELAYERSGPERFLSTFPLFVEYVRIAAREGDARATAAIGALFADLTSLRQLSIGVAASLERGETPTTAAALVKDLGTRFENEVINRIAETLTVGRGDEGYRRLWTQYETAILQAPGFTLRGGATEILRGLVARGLGLR